MPVTRFESFTDGLEPNQRVRGHIISDTDIDNDELWVPYAEGVWLQPCSFNLVSGVYSLVLKGVPGAQLGAHYHTGTVHGYTLRGHWRYLEYGWVAKPGSFIFEPSGEAHTLVVTDDSPEPMVAFFVVEGGLVYLENAKDGGFSAYEDGFTVLDLTRKHYREAGLDMRRIDALVR